MLEPAHTGLQEQIAKISEMFQASGQVGNLKLAMVGVLTPQKLAVTINQDFFGGGESRKLFSKTSMSGGPICLCSWWRQGHSLKLIWPYVLPPHISSSKQLSDLTSPETC